MAEKQPAADGHYYPRIPNETVEFNVSQRNIHIKTNYSMKNILALSLFLMLASCQKETNCEPPVGINGEWIWVESNGGLSGSTFTPETEGFTRRLAIDDFFFREYVNDSLAFESEYDLKISTETLLGTEEKTYIEYANGGAQAILIGATELTLIDQCFDCFFHIYRRPPI